MKSIGQDGRRRVQGVGLTAITAFVGKVITVSTNLISIPLTIDYLGAERFGLWMTISSVVLFMSVADLGIGNSLINAVASAVARKDVGRLRGAISSAVFMLVGISFILSVIFYVFGPQINWAVLFNVLTEETQLELGRAMVVFGLMFSVGIPLSVFGKIRQGLQQGYIEQIFLALGALVSFGSILLCVYYQSGLEWLVFSLFIGPLVGAAANGVFLVLSSDTQFFSAQALSRRESASLLTSGWYFFLLQVCTIVSSSSDNFVITHVFGPSEVGVYAIVFKIFLLTQLGQYVIQPMWPVFSEALSLGRTDWALEVLKKLTIYSAITSAVIALFISLLTPHILRYWVGADVEIETSLLFGMATFTVVASYGGCMSVYLNSTPRLIRMQVPIFAVFCIASVILKILFAQTFGVSGVIWGAVVATIIFYIYPSQLVAKMSGVKA